MNYRMSILIVELQRSSKLNAENFMKEFQISYRTLKNDINELNRDLGREYIKISSDVIEVQDHERYKNESRRLLNDTNFYSYRMTKEERMVLESMLMLFAEKYVTAHSLCNYLMVSRGTILNDLAQLRKILEEKGLSLISITNHGFLIRGEEEKVRDYLENCAAINYQKKSPFYVEQVQHLLKKGLNMDAISFELIKEMEQCEIVLNDDSYRRLLNYLAISYKRMMLGFFLQDKETDYGEPEHKFFLEKCASEYFDVKLLTREEIFRFTKKLHFILEAGRGISTDADESMKISSFVWDVCQKLDIIQELGYENYQGLYNHLISTIYYLKENKDIPENPFCDEIKETYPEICECIAQSIHIIQELVEKKIDENGMSYIAMHIASALEGNKNKEAPLHAVIVCPKGRCVSLLLRARILKYFNIIIDDMIPVYMLNKDLNVDFVISTVPAEDVSCPVVVVGQMFLQEDVEKMQEFLQKIYKLTKERQVINKIEDYVQEYQTITMGSVDVTERLQNLNARYMDDHIKEDADKQFFYRMLSADHILLDSPVTDWVEAIRQAGNMLLKDDILTEAYIDKMISLINENGPYIVFQPGFVIAHAGPEDGAKKLGISLVRLNEPIQFSTSDIKVKFVVCLSIPDKKSHVFLMFQMYKCLTNARLFHYLSETATIDEFQTIIRIFELTGED